MFSSRRAKILETLLTDYRKLESDAPEAADVLRRIHAIEVLEFNQVRTRPPKPRTAAPKPARVAALVASKPMSEAELLQSARAALEVGCRLESLTKGQRAALEKAGGA